GMLRETAQRLAGAVRARAEAERPAEERAAERRRVMELAASESLSKGVTSFHDAGTGFGTIDLMKELESEGALPVRLYVMIRESNDELQRRLPDYYMPAD